MPQDATTDRAGLGDRVLTGLVGDPEAFAVGHWDRAPLLRRGVWPDPAPLTVDDVDRLLTSSGLRWPAFRLVREGESLPPGDYTRSGRIGGRGVSDLADVDRVLDLVADGATLVLQGLHRSHPPVAELCRALEAALGHPTQTNAYLTPPDARGLAVHHDTHDVFALQTHGRKHWVVHEPAVVAPLPHQAWSADEHEPGEQVLDVHLDPGDLLYLPRGTPHAAETIGGVSLHLTIGIRPVTWYDVVRRAVEDLDDDVELRRALPLRFAENPEALADVVRGRLATAASSLAEADADGLARALAEERRRAQRPSPRGRLTELVDLDRIDDDTRLVRPDGLALTMSTDDGRLTLRLADRDVSLPAAAEPAVTRLLDGGEHRLDELADRLDAESRRVLARRLVREGVLRARSDVGG